MTKNTNDNLDNYINIIVRLKSIFVFLLSLLLITKCCNGIEALNNYCPDYCVCRVWYQLQWVSCRGKQLINVHTGVNYDVQALDLSNNSISKLKDYEFVMIGMKKLKYLNLSDNAISEIGLFAFAQLNQLAVLDLSRNHFNYFNSDTFIDNKKLRIVKLNGNNFHSGIPCIKNPTITDLSLNSCQISHLPLGIFNGLGQLNNLDISNNIIIELDIKILKTLPFLQKLTIDRNPWMCNNAMISLKKYLNSKLIIYNSSICYEKKLNFNDNIKYEKIILDKIKNNKQQSSDNINNKYIVLSNNIRNNDKLWNNSLIKLSKLSNDNYSNSTNNHNTSLIVMLLSSVWFFLAGLITGCAVGMISIYIWLSRQQFHLSRQYPLLDNCSLHSNDTLPTYCEVMLNLNRYPSV